MAQLVSLIRIEWIVTYPVDSVRHLLNIRGQLAQVFQKVDNALHWINLYPLYSVIITITKLSNLIGSQLPLFQP